ncbi:MAG: disulfide bond formation protein B [Methylohalobius sp.]|nr:disulfide bond formation protein B [Methylohalobius sp.]
MLPKPRLGFFLGFLFCISLLVIAAWLQFGKGLEPCPLCITQRAFVLVVGLVLLAAAWHNPNRLGRRIYATLAGSLALLGSLVSARHVWLQHLPKDEVPACGPGLSYVLEHFPLTETLKVLVSGTGECSEIDWSFLGLSIPAWTWLAFLLLAGWALWNGWRDNTP